jgi:hypothetical protein
MTLRGIRSNCGNLQRRTLHTSLLNNPGLFLDFSWCTGYPEVIHTPKQRINRKLTHRLYFYNLD